MDIRAERSKAALKNALYDCMKEKKISDITVTELCNSAGLDRTTFYRRYKYIDDIVIELEQEQLNDFRELMSKKTGEPLLIDILYAIDRAQGFCQTEAGFVLSERFKNGLIDVAKEYGLQMWREQLPIVDPQGVEISFEALLAGTLHAALAMGDKVSNEKKAKLIMDMIHAYIQSRA